MRKAVVVAGALAAATLAIVATRGHRSDPIAQLVKAAKDVQYRTTEARLSGGFPYRPLEPVTRGATSTPVIAAAAMVYRGGRTRRSVGDLHALGISHLMLRQWEPAVEALDQAIRTETQREAIAAALASSSDARLLSDFAAAHHQLARSSGNARHDVIAAEAALRAWRLEATPETAWNRALTAESLHLESDALTAWADYLRLDGDSEWAAEVAAHMRKLTAPSTAALWQDALPRLERAVIAGDASEARRIVQAFPLEARRWAEDGALLEWAANPAREERLAACRFIGGALRESSGESLLADTVEDIDRADPARRTAIVRGLAVYAGGRTAYRAAEFAKARPQLLDAFDILNRARSPFAQLARMYALGCERFVDDPAVLAASDAWLASGSLNERRHQALTAQIRWIRGLSSLRLGRPQAAIEEYERAVAIFERLGETDFVATIQLMISEVYEYLGHSSGEWTHRLAALEQRGRSGSQQPILLEQRRYAADAALLEGLPAVAVLFLDHLIAVCNDPSRSNIQFMALLSRARARRALGDRVGEASDLRDARLLASRITDVRVRMEFMNWPEVVADRVSITADSREREAILRNAIEFARARGLALPLAQLHLQQGRESIAMKRWGEAESTLLAGIEALERERESISDEDYRGSFLSAHQTLYDTLVGLLCRSGDYRRALDVVERGRARTLLERFGGGDGRPARARQLQEALSDDTALVAFAPAGETLGVWLVTRSRLDFVRIPIDGETILRRVDRLRLALRGGDQDAAMAASRMLHDAVVRPWRARVAGFERLILVPHAELAGVPFAALHDGATYLVQQHILTTAPSASVWLACAARRPAQQTRAALIVSASEVRDHAVLAAARGESSRLAGLYRDAVVLDGPRATRAEFVERAPAAEIIHFGGHSSSGSLPRLVFAAEGPNDAAFMHAEEIRQLALNNTRVVVLASCDSGSEHLSPDRHGTSSLARAFLAAGVPAVVAGYWEVDDEATAKLSQRFHNHFSRGSDPAAALRLAQLEMIRASDGYSRKVSSWAAFAVIGGTENEERRSK